MTNHTKGKSYFDVGDADWISQSTKKIRTKIQRSWRGSVEDVRLKQNGAKGEGKLKSFQCSAVMRKVRSLANEMDELGALAKIQQSNFSVWISDNRLGLDNPGRDCMQSGKHEGVVSAVIAKNRWCKGGFTQQPCSRGVVFLTCLHHTKNNQTSSCSRHK